MPGPASPCRWLGGVAVAALLSTTPVSATTDPSYEALRSSRPDGRRLAVTQPFTLERDAFRFELTSGSIHFLAPVNGRTYGAVFVGSGGFKLLPATEDERRHLAFVSGRDNLEVLSDSFDSLLLLFGDDTAEELALLGTIETGAPDARAAEVFESLLARQRQEFDVNFLIRLLQDLLNTPELKSGVFLAYLDGRDLPPAIAAVDPRGIDALQIGPLMGGEDTAFYVGDEVRGGFWYACDRVAEVKRGRRTPYRPTIDALHYTIDTEVRRNEELAGTTTLRLKAEAPVRVVPLYLVSLLRISEASFRGEGSEQWTPIAFVQEGEKEHVNAAVVLPEILPKGTTFEVKLQYAGKEVIWDLGFDIYAVLARTSWYPNVSIFTDLATFDLTYRVPKGNDVVSVGTHRGTTSEERWELSTWKAELPIRVAGFNYGKFTPVPRRDEISGLGITVHANHKMPEMVGRSVQSEVAETIVDPEGLTIVTSSPGQSTGRLSPAKLAEGVAVDCINAARLFHTYFGPLPQQEVAVAQQFSFGFGQSWPSLIYLPYSAFMTGTARNVIGLTGFGYDEFVKDVAFHEMAHQWWGHLVGWDSYRDQWLSEGFAEFSAMLAVQHTLGWEEYGKRWKEKREHISSRTGTVTAATLGPITRGLRLATAKSPAAYSIVAYEKGAFVLHMLRMMMFDPALAQPDAHFIALMRDFTATYADKSPSTQDFKTVVERHVLPSMNATGDGKMDWFFDQWVYGTELPLLKSSLAAKKVAEGEYQVTGSVAIEGVSESFRALVPIYADFGKGRLAVIGRLPMSGSGSRPVDVKVKLPEKPRQIVANARYDVLTREP